MTIEDLGAWFATVLIIEATLLGFQLILLVGYHLWNIANPRSKTTGQRKF